MEASLAEVLRDLAIKAREHEAVIRNTLGRPVFVKLGVTLDGLQISVTGGGYDWNRVAGWEQLELSVLEVGKLHLAQASAEFLNRYERAHQEILQEAFPATTQGALV